MSSIALNFSMSAGRLSVAPESQGTTGRLCADGSMDGVARSRFGDTGRPGRDRSIGFPFGRHIEPSGCTRGRFEDVGRVIGRWMRTKSQDFF